MAIHEKGVQKLFQHLLDKGDIYKGEYKGWYCVSDENFLTEDAPADKDGTKICPDCGQAAVVLAEETYFFRLSAYQQKLLDHYEAHPEFVRPPSRMNEVASFVRGGLRDLSITRTTVKWGVPVPGDPAHTIYVWFDALHNYLTGLGWDWDMERFEKFWPASLHLIGKDILRFHAVFWPAFLMASGFALPECVFGHGWWLKDEAKMSKSKGNVLDPYVIIDALGPDPLRYFLLREIPIGLDGNFSHEGFIHRVNSDLANDFGNLVHRTLTMIQQYFGGTLGEPGRKRPPTTGPPGGLREDQSRRPGALRVLRRRPRPWRSCGPSSAWPTSTWPTTCPGSWPRTRQSAAPGPGAVADGRGHPRRQPPGRAGHARLGPQDLGSAGRDGLAARRPLCRFPLRRFESGPADEGADAALPPRRPEGIPGRDARLRRPPRRRRKPAPKETTMDIITYEEFKKLDLRVALVLKAERVEGATKLLKLQIDLGTEQRQIVAGVAETYAPEELVGKRFTVIANLKPAVIRGVESQGMLLAGIKDGKAVIPFFEGDIPPGSKVQ